MGSKCNARQKCGLAFTVAMVFVVPSGSGVLSRAFVLSAGQSSTIILVSCKACPAYSFTPYEKNMHPDTFYLKTFAEEIAKTAPENHTAELHRRLETEAEKLEKSIVQSLLNIDNATQRDTFYFNTLTRLVNISDILFNVNHALSADVSVVMNLIENVRQTYPMNCGQTSNSAKHSSSCRSPFLQRLVINTGAKWNDSRSTLNLSPLQLSLSSGFIWPTINSFGAISPG